MAKSIRRILGHEHCEYQDAPLRGRQAIAGRTSRDPDAVRIRRAWESPDGPGVGLDPSTDRLAVRAVFGRCWRVTRLETAGEGVMRREVAHESFFVTVQDEPPRIVFAGGKGGTFAVEG